MSRKTSLLKRIFFALAAAGISTVLMIGGLLGADLYLHHRFEKVAGLNIRGYRGPVLKKRQPGEQRVAVLGGSTALGYGVAPDESFPADLERNLNERRRAQGARPLHVVNLGGNAQGAYAFLPTLREYEYLGCDTVIFYEGYNDLGKFPNEFVARDGSPIYRLTGYYPIFPLIFKEKAMSLRYGGNIDAAYWGKKTVFRPSLAARTTAGALEATVHLTESVGRGIAYLAPTPQRPPVNGMGCSAQHAFYCHWVYQATQAALDHGQRVVVVTQPYLTKLHVRQQQEMAAMLKRQFGKTPYLRYVNLGKAINLQDRMLSYDREHLTATGNQRIADLLTEPVLEMIEQAQGTSQRAPRRSPSP